MEVNILQSDMTKELKKSILNFIDHGFTKKRIWIYLKEFVLLSLIKKILIGQNMPKDSHPEKEITPTVKNDQGISTKYSDGHLVVISNMEERLKNL